MKVAYIFSTQGHTVSYKLGKMILPQLEAGTHGVDVVGMFFFEDNNYVLVTGDPLGERLAKVAREAGHAVDGLRPVLLRARDRRQAGRRCRDRLLSESLRGTFGQYAGSGDHPVVFAGAVKRPASRACSAG